MSFRALAVAVILLYMSLQAIISSSIDVRISGGQLSTIEDHPYMVSTWLNGSHYCGGTLITPTCVLTAAHCYKSYVHSPSSRQLSAGTTKWWESEQIRLATGIYIPSNYNVSRSYDMDVAILTLNAPFEGENIKVVELDFENDVQQNDVITVAGWGRDDNYTYPNRPHTPFNESLHELDLPVVDDELCRDPDSSISENMFCVRGGQGENACNGDSGSPAMDRVSGKQVGVFSLFWTCGFPYHKPNVFVRLASKQVSSYVKGIVAEHC